MAPLYLLDTNICIYTLSGRHAGLTARVGALRAGQAVLSVVVWGELLYGIAKSHRRHDAELRLAALTTVASVASLPVDAGRHYGDIRATLEHHGTPIGANDLWIAAHARAAGLIMVTANLREFCRVPALTVENWLVESR